MKDLIKKPIIPILVALPLILVVVVWANQTAAQAPAPFRFISWSDAQDRGTNLPVTSSQAVTLNPAFTIFTGDFERDGFQPAEMNLMVNALNGDASGNTSNGMFDKTFLVRGNGDNDYNNPADWQEYLVQADRPPVPGVTSHVGMNANTTFVTYAFDYENARFIGLDDPGAVYKLSTAQITWLDEMLTDAETNHPELGHAFVFFHGPIYCIGFHCTCSAANDPACISPTSADLISVFNRHPIVSATFHGHEHDLAWTHIDSERITDVTHEYEQFVTSPSGSGSYDGYLEPQRVDYAAMTGTQGFASIDVNGPEFTVSFYKIGVASPVWSKRFCKFGACPTRTPTPTSTPTATGTLTASSTATATPTGASGPSATPSFAMPRILLPLLRSP